MLTLPTQAQLDLARESRRLVVSGVVYKNDGSTLRCTQSDQDLAVNSGDLAGLYVAINAVTTSDMTNGSDLSVDNLEISGSLMAPGMSFSGFTAQDIEAGLFDTAPFEMFLCDWSHPSAWQKICRRGYLGQITRSSEGQFQAEWRGLTQLLAQNIGQSADENCNVVRFGDSRCKINRALFTGTGVVTGVTSRSIFQTTITWPGGAKPAGFADLGELQFTTGQNAPYLVQVRDDDFGSSAGQIQLWEGLPYDVSPGDNFAVVAGCDRLFETCVGKFNNVLNFRGHGHWSPGIPAIIRAPG